MNYIELRNWIEQKVNRSHNDFTWNKTVDIAFIKNWSWIIGYMSHYSHITMLSKYGYGTCLLKIKNTSWKSVVLTNMSGRILDILRAFLIKQLSHSRLLIC